MYCNLDVNVKDIKFFRIGKSFKKNVCRPLKVIFPSANIVHWIFSNTMELAKSITKGLVITSDRTKAQIDYYKSVKKIRDKKILNGETDVVIKYRYGTPYLAKKEKNDNENSKN